MKRTASGRFTPTPPGEKTPRMLEVQKKLGRTLEEDFNEYHLKKKWGQKRIANRWGVPRGLIFARSLKGGRRSWVQMLNLPVRRLDGKPVSQKQVGAAIEACEICSKSDVSLDKAHWVSAAEGGSNKSFNMLKLCPNCHRRLDRGNSEITEEARRILLFREARKLIEGSGGSEFKRKRLAELCRAILERKPLH